MRKTFLLALVFLLLASRGATEESLTLEKCVELALKNSPAIHQAWLEKKKAAAKIREARTAFYPQLGLSANYTRLDESPSIEGGSFGNISFGDDDIYSLKGSAQQPLYTGGKIDTSYRMAKISKELADWNYGNRSGGTVFCSGSQTRRTQRRHGETQRTTNEV